VSKEERSKRTEIEKKEAPQQRRKVKDSRTEIQDDELQKVSKKRTKNFLILPEQMVGDAEGHNAMKK